MVIQEAFNVLITETTMFFNGRFIDRRKEGLDKSSKVYIAGHTGVIGSAIYKLLSEDGYRNLVVKKHQELDLMEYSQVMDFFETESPEYVFYCAGRDGNADFLKYHGAEIFRHHIVMQTNVIHASCCSGVKRLLYTGSGACYGTDEKSPFKEENAVSAIQRGMVQPYSAAKVAGLVMCEAYRNEYGCDFRSVLPCHLFSYNNLDKEESNVLEEIIKRICVAKKNDFEICDLNIWGNGEARTKYIFQEECADAFIFTMRMETNEGILNVCPEESYSLSEIAGFVKKFLNYNGKLRFEEDKVERKEDRYMSSDKITSLGWKPKHSVLDRIGQLCSYYYAKL